MQQSPQPTSLETFEQIRQDGTLTGLQLLAYEMLWKHGPCTAGELGKHVTVKGLWKRLSELRDRKVALELGKRKCTQTKRPAMVWMIIDGLPQAVEEFDFATNWAVLEEVGTWHNEQVRGEYPSLHTAIQAGRKEVVEHSDFGKCVLLSACVLNKSTQQWEWQEI